VDFAKREKGEALMFDWFKRKNDKAVSPSSQAVSVNSINAVPLNDEKPILHVVYPVQFRNFAEQKSYSVKLVSKICDGCRSENHPFLIKNHNSKLLGCEKQECRGRKLLKVMLEN